MTDTTPQHAPPKNTPMATWAFIAINIAVWALIWAALFFALLNPVIIPAVNRWVWG